MTRMLLSFIVALATLATSGCGKQIDILIRHPLQAGVVDQPNTIQARNGWQASLLSLDPNGMCFDISFTARQANSPPNMSLAAQELLMKSDGQWYRDAQVNQERQPIITTSQGTVPQQYQAGTTTECVNRDSRSQQCNRWEERPRYETRYVPATFFDAQGGGIVCFPNGGRVTPMSDRVAFSINRTHFRWGLQSIVQATTQGGEATQ